MDFKIQDNIAEISYLFDYDYWHQGYCSEACQKLIEIAFRDLKLEKIKAESIVENQLSIRVLKRLGFKEEYFEEKDSHKFIHYCIDNKEEKE